MAVRRVSDLPDLNIYYPSAQLSDAMIEISYAKPEAQRKYLSFSMNAYAMISSIVNNIVNDLPIASKTKLGVVQIDNNIDVTTAGKISVKNATTAAAGVLKAPPAGAAYIGTNADGSWKSVAAPSGGTGNLDNYDVVNTTYPKGSVFIAAQPSIYPPGVIAPPSSGDEWTGMSKSGMPTMKWKKITGCSLWATGTNNEVGQTLSAVLPSPASIMTATCNAAGDHYHKQKKTTVSVEGSGSHSNKTVLQLMESTTSSGTYKYMQTTGEHTHTVTFNQSTTANTVYHGVDNTVRPTSLGVGVWVRTT